MARRIASIKSFFKYFYQEKFIESNPTDRIRIPKVPKRAPSSLSQDEVRQFIAAPSPGDKDFLLNRAVLVLMYSVGLRVSELASLRVENINLERRIVVIPGKGAKERIVPLQDPVIDVLLSYFDEREKLYPESMAPKNNAFLKPSASGLVPMNVRRIQYLVEKHGKIAGLSTHVHPHLLRHSIATHLIEEGCSVEAVRQTLGHEDLATTSIYLKTASKFLKDEHNKHNPVSNLLNS